MGGAKFLAPIINEIDPNLYEMIIHPLSKIFIEKFFPDKKYELLNIGENKIEDFWQMRMPAYSSVITTTSSKIIDQTNSVLIQVCRDNSIPSR